MCAMKSRATGTEQPPKSPKQTPERRLAMLQTGAILVIMRLDFLSVPDMPRRWAASPPSWLMAKACKPTPALPNSD
jgi:hypothetical protein